MRKLTPKLQRNHAGLDGFIWAVGVVEDRNDPLMLGRCKVRYFGWHSEDKQEMPTSKLPWSVPMIPLDSGRNPIGPTEGDWICGFARDGIIFQEPVMMGILPGIPEIEANPAKGFNDPRPDSVLNSDTVPRNPLSHPIQHDDGTGSELIELGQVSRFPQNEPNDGMLRFVDQKEAITNRFERNEFQTQTVVKAKKDNLEIGQTNVPEDSDTPNPAPHVNSGVGSDALSNIEHFTEKETPYAGKYPYNHAYFSESGHLIEVDDTPGAQRLHWYHRSGSFKEIHPSGLTVEKIVDKEYHIVLKGRYTHIENSDVEVVDHRKQIVVNKNSLSGQNYDLTVCANSDMNFTIQKGQHNTYVMDGDRNARVNKNNYYLIQENEVGTIKRNRAVTVCADDTLHVYGNVNIIVHKDCNINAGGNINVQSGKSMNFISGTDMTFFCGGSMKTKVMGSKSQFVLGTETNHGVAPYCRLCDTNISVRAIGNYQQKSLMYNEVAMLNIKRSAPSITDIAIGPGTYKCLGFDIKLQAGRLINLDSLIDIKAKATKLVKLESTLDNVEFHAVRDVFAKAKQWIHLEASELPGYGILQKAEKGIIKAWADLNIWLNDELPLIHAEDGEPVYPVRIYIPPIKIPFLPDIQKVMGELSAIADEAVSVVTDSALFQIAMEVNALVTQVDAMVMDAVNTFNSLQSMAEGIMAQALAPVQGIVSSVNQINGLVNSVANLPANIGQSFSAAAQQAISSNVVTQIVDHVNNAIDSATQQAIDTINSTVSGYTQTIDTFIKNADQMIEAGKTNSGDSFSDLSSETQKQVDAIVNKVENPIPDSVQNAIDSVLSTYEPPIEDYTLSVVPRNDQSGCDVTITHADQTVCSTQWQNNTQYKKGNRVYRQSNIYTCKVEHTSSSNFDNDLANWNGGNTALADLYEEKFYYDGDRVLVDGDKVYRCATRGPGGPTFGTGEAAWELERTIIPVETKFFVDQTPMDHES